MPDNRQKKKSLLLATTLVAFAAAPVLAMDMAADAMLGAVPEDMTTMKPVQDSAFMGNEVSTKDQVVIGLVDGVYEGPDGSMLALVTISADIASKSSVKNVTVPLTRDDVADGALTLRWTEAELFTELDGTFLREGD